LLNLHKNNLRIAQPYLKNDPDGACHWDFEDTGFSVQTPRYKALLLKSKRYA